MYFYNIDICLVYSAIVVRYTQSGMHFVLKMWYVHTLEGIQSFYKENMLYDFPGIKPASSLMSCPSTIRDILLCVKLS